MREYGESREYGDIFAKRYHVSPWQWRHHRWSLISLFSVYLTLSITPRWLPWRWRHNRLIFDLWSLPLSQTRSRPLPCVSRWTRTTRRRSIGNWRSARISWRWWVTSDCRVTLDCPKEPWLVECKDLMKVVSNGNLLGEKGITGLWMI